MDKEHGVDGFEDAKFEFNADNRETYGTDNPALSIENQELNQGLRRPGAIADSGHVEIQFNRDPTSSFPVRFTEDSAIENPVVSSVPKNTGLDENNLSAQSSSNTRTKHSATSETAIPTQTHTEADTAQDSRMRQINTRNPDPLQWRQHHDMRPLTQRHMLLLKIFSIIGAIVFFPTGIPAVYYAYQTEKEFEAGILRGDIDKALKFGKRTEHLIIFSGLFALLLAVIIFGIVEGSILQSGNHMNNRIMPQG